MVSAAVFPSLRKEIVKRAKIAMVANRYTDMLNLMKKVVAETDNLTVEERILLSVAYENVIVTLFNSRRIISWIEKEKRCGHKDDETDTVTLEERNRLTVLLSMAESDKLDVSAVSGYRSAIESGISSFCDDVLLLLDSRLIPSASDDESKVFYLKMKGDYGRYLAEIKNGAERKEAVENTLSAYRLAQEIANAKLSPAHRIWLELAVNFSIFYLEFLNSPKSAFKLSKQAYDGALKELKTRATKPSTLKELKTRGRKSSMEDPDIHAWPLQQLFNLNVLLKDYKQDDGADEIKEAPNRNGEQPRFAHSQLIRCILSKRQGLTGSGLELST